MKAGSDVKNTKKGLGYFALQSTYTTCYIKWLCLLIYARKHEHMHSHTHIYVEVRR